MWRSIPQDDYREGNNPTRHDGNACNPSTLNFKPSLGYIMKLFPKKKKKSRRVKEEQRDGSEEKGAGRGGRRE